MGETFTDPEAAIKWLHAHCDLITSRKTHNTVRQYDFQTTDREGLQVSVLLSLDTDNADLLQKGFVDAANRLAEHKK